MTGNPRNAIVCATPYLKNEFGDPRFFFTFLILSYHFLLAVKVLKKSVRGKFLGANVLKWQTGINKIPRITTHVKGQL